jgi:hypothetical protein
MTFLIADWATCISRRGWVYLLKRQRGFRGLNCSSDATNDCELCVIVIVIVTVAAAEKGNQMRMQYWIAYNKQHYYCFRVVEVYSSRGTSLTHRELCILWCFFLCCCRRRDPWYMCLVGVNDALPRLWTSTGQDTVLFESNGNDFNFLAGWFYIRGFCDTVISALLPRYNRRSLLFRDACCFAFRSFGKSQK